MAGERVITLDDGRTVCDPWVLLDNWMEKYGLADAEGEEFFAALDEYHEFEEAEAMTGSLFGEGVTA